MIEYNYVSRNTSFIRIGVGVGIEPVSIDIHFIDSDCYWGIVVVCDKNYHTTKITNLNAIDIEYCIDDSDITIHIKVDRTENYYYINYELIEN